MPASWNARGTRLVTQRASCWRRRRADGGDEDLPLVEVDERTALIREPDGRWRSAGAGSVSIWLAGHQADLAALPA